MEFININNIKTNYMIDKQGNIYNSKTKKFLSGTIRNGYRMVKLTVNNIKKDYSVHRLVALTFIPNPDNKKEVNHIDRNKLNNQVNNLEWVNSSENMKHVIQTGRKSRQKIKKTNLDITLNNGWYQYENTNYWVNAKGECVNIINKNFLNPVQTNDGYLVYNLYINKKRKRILAHRLIYSSFYNIPIDNLQQINHIDGNKINNNINNLEEVSRQENMHHSYYILEKNIKKVYQYDLNKNFVSEYKSLSEAARINDINVSGICQACKNKLKTYKNYYWSYEKM